MECKICHSSDIVVVYEGPIRLGKYGHLSEKNGQVYECRSCCSRWLPGMIENHEKFYETESYRSEVDGDSDVEDYFLLHDGEQLRHLTMSGTSVFRGKVVADIGCGAGSFLDYVKGVCKIAIAIEPSTTFRKSLKERGYMAYPYVIDALPVNKGQVDVAVSFSVIEHVPDPVNFLKEINSLLSDGGKLIISTPNADDILLDVIPEVYKSFFYRKAHIWYFNHIALQNLLVEAGFKNTIITPFHRFGMGNFLSWIRDKSPKGDTYFDYISKTMDTTWKSELERTWRSDYLFAISIKGQK